MELTPALCNILTTAASNHHGHCHRTALVKSSAVQVTKYMTSFILFMMTDINTLNCEIGLLVSRTLGKQSCLEPSSHGVGQRRLGTPSDVTRSPSNNSRQTRSV